MYISSTWYHTERERKNNRPPFIMYSYAIFINIRDRQYTRNKQTMRMFSNHSNVYMDTCNEVRSEIRREWQ